MGQTNRWETLIREAWRNYRNPSQLKISTLTSTKLTDAWALENDQPQHHVYGVQAVLLWAREQLIQSGRAGKRAQAEVLRLRYVEGLTVTQTVAELDRPESTIKTQQRSGIKATAKILAQEAEQLQGVGWYRPKSLTLRLAALDPATRPLLQFLALLRRPVPQRIALFAEEIVFQPYTQQLAEANLLLPHKHNLALHPELCALINRSTPIQILLHNHKTAAEFYEREDALLEEAIYHWQHAGEQAHAADLLLARSAELPTHTILTLLANFDHNPSIPRDIRAQLKLLEGQAIEQSDQFEQQIDKAIALYDKALDTDNLLIQAEACYRLARAHQRRNPQTSLVYYADAQRLLLDATSETAQQWLADVYISRAWIYIDQIVDQSRVLNDLNSAEIILNQGSNSKRWQQLRSDWHSTWGGFHRQQKQYDASLTARRQAWLAARQARDVTRTIKTGYNLGILYIQREQFDNAQRHLSESQALAQEAGNGRMTALCNKALGGSYVLDGKRYEQALPFYDAAYTHFKHSGNQWWLATICYDLVEVLVMLGRLGEAMAYLQEGEAMMLPNTKSAEIYASLRKQFFELSAEFTPRQRQIIHHVRVNKRIDKRTCHTLLDISTTQALRELTELVEQNILQRIGKGRGTHYTFNPAFLSPHEDI